LAYDASVVPTISKSSSRGTVNPGVQNFKLSYAASVVHTMSKSFISLPGAQ
jgi:hypothetical protein